MRCCQLKTTLSKNSWTWPVTKMPRGSGSEVHFPACCSISEGPVSIGPAELRDWSSWPGGGSCFPWGFVQKVLDPIFTLSCGMREKVQEKLIDSDPVLKHFSSPTKEKTMWTPCPLWEDSFISLSSELRAVQGERGGDGTRQGCAVFGTASHLAVTLPEAAVLWRSVHSCAPAGKVALHGDEWCQMC